MFLHSVEAAYQIDVWENQQELPAYEKLPIKEDDTRRLYQMIPGLKGRMGGEGDEERVYY